MAQLKDTIINGDLEVTGILTTTMGGDQHSLLDLIYPVGSVILTRDPDFTPSNYWGGTWYKWTDGYLKCNSTINNSESGDTVTANTNASAIGDYTIDVNQLPPHSHYYTPEGSLSNSNLTGNVEFPDTMNVGDLSQTLISSSGIFSINHSYVSKSYTLEVNGTDGDTDLLTIDASHIHNFTGTRTNTEQTGSGAECKPKYYAVIAWQRTA